MVIVTFKLPYKLLEELDRYAIVYGVSRSEVIRKAVEEYIKKDGLSKVMPKWRVKRVVLT